MAEDHEHEAYESPSDALAEYAVPDTGEMPEEDVEAMNQTLPMILSFLVIPLLIVIVGIGIMLSFGMLTYEGVSPERYVSQLQSGSANRRWQSAFELAKLINNDPAAMRERGLAEPLIALFSTMPVETEEDRTARRYLATSLGRLGDPAAIPALTAALDDEDSATRIHVLMALGDLQAGSAAPQVIPLLQDEDFGIAKAAAYALGEMDAPGVSDALAPMLDHAAADVRWNAAQSLAQRGDARAVRVLQEMLTRDRVEAEPDITEEQIELVMTNGIRCAAVVPWPGLHDTLRALAEDDPNLRVRNAAFQTLEILREQPQSLANVSHMAA